MGLNGEITSLETSVETNAEEASEENGLKAEREYQDTEFVCANTKPRIKRRSSGIWFVDSGVYATFILERTPSVFFIPDISVGHLRPGDRT
mgnify:CR=1 FL=1